MKCSVSDEDNLIHDHPPGDIVNQDNLLLIRKIILSNAL